MSILFKGLIAALALCYPFAIYLGLQHFSVRYVAIGLFILLALRLFMMRSMLMTHAKSLLLPSMVGVLMSAFVIISGGEAHLTLMPVAINTGFFIAFSVSLLKPPCIIEVLARLQEPDLPEAGVKYTQKVTVAWCVFFIVLGSLSLYTHFLGDLKVWTLFNGFIAYVMIGAFGGIEWLIRQKVKASHLASDLALSKGDVRSP